MRMNEKQAKALGLELQAFDHVMVGTTAIFGEGNDVDWLFHVPYIPDAGEALQSAGMVRDGEYESNSMFRSYRLGGTNVIICDDLTYFKAFRAACWVCKLLQVRCKTERIAVHRIIRDGVSFQEATMKPSIHKWAGKWRVCRTTVVDTTTTRALEFIGLRVPATAALRNAQAQAWCDRQNHIEGRSDVRYLGY